MIVFLEKYNAKSTEKGVNLKNRLNFLLKISNSIDKIKTKLETPMKVINPEMLKEVEKKVPVDTMYEGANLHMRLRDQITVLNIRQSKAAWKLSNDVCSAIAFRPLFKYGEIFDEWNNEQFTKEYFERVESELRTIATEYEKWHGQFNDEIKEANQERFIIEKIISLTNDAFGSLNQINDPKEATKTVINLIIPLLNRISKAQTALFGHLKQLQHILKEYNEARFVWIEFLIGMRESITSGITEDFMAENMILYINF